MTDVLRCAGLAKSFGPVRAVDGFDLTVREGEIVALLGASGCGKTTVLRLIAGLEHPDAGTVDIREHRMAGGGAWVPPERRRVGLVFQDSALFPHLDVRSNVAFGVGGRSDDRVRAMFELARLVGLEHRMPHELSGGQQQRVALARALAPGPDLLLLDEPFSNLDAQLRSAVRQEVRDVVRATGTTAIFVTHDQEEALSIADRVAVMLHGAVRQFGTPFEIYAGPIDGEVATLAGEVNVLAATARGGRATSAVGEIEAPGITDGPCRVLVRPEALRAIPDPAGSATVVGVSFFGHDQLVRCALATAGSVEVRLMGPHPELAPGTTVRLELVGPARAISGHVVPVA